MLYRIQVCLSTGKTTEMRENMNEHAILHIPDSRYCFATGERELTIRLRMAKEDKNCRVFLVYACKYDFGNRQETVLMEQRCQDRLYLYYEITMKLTDVRFAYIFRIEEQGKTYYFSEDGLTEDYCFKEGFYNFFQMPYINSNDVMPTVDWMRNAVFYQIFVERFCRGNEEKDDSYINMKWDDKPTPKSFAGGDLRGIIGKIGYLKELGVTAIYLTPVFLSDSNHKYDTKDYFTVDPQFGTNEDLVELVKRAHDAGMKVVLDAVFNHCSMYLKQFQDVLHKGRESEYYDWFLIDGDFPEPEKMNYECFASCDYMPKLNTANSDVQNFLLDIVHYWMKEADIDGWRLDVSDEVSHDFWRLFRKEVKKQKPDAVIIGENWHDAYPYLMGDQYDSIMNYAFTKACLDYFAKGKFNAGQMAEKLNGNYMRNMRQVNDMMLNLLDSHDTFRFFTEVGCDKDILLAALALEMIYPGAACLYYGTEVCMEGGFDPDSRRGFPWDETKWDEYVGNQIRQMTEMRARDTIRLGDARIDARGDLLEVCRSYENRRLTLYINMTDEDVSLPASSVLLSNRLENGVLKSRGYVIIEG